MKQQDSFRYDYPYGLVFDLQTKSYGLFNRDYRRLGADTSQPKVALSELAVTKNNQINQELIKELKKYSNIHRDMCYQYYSDNRYFHLWLYNDSTNPTAMGERDVVKFDVYYSRLQRIAYMLKESANSLHW